MKSEKNYHTLVFFPFFRFKFLKIYSLLDSKMPFNSNNTAEVPNWYGSTSFSWWEIGTVVKEISSPRDYLTVPVTTTGKTRAIE